MNRVGLIMAGGKGTRLYPTTSFVNKHLLLIYDKPLIYYPLSTLMLLGIKNIYLVTNKNDVQKFKYLIKLSKNLGIELKIISQSSPRGILDGLLLLKKKKIQKDVFMILGDNIIYGSKISSLLNSKKDISKIFSYEVNETESFGIYEKKLNKIIEKPEFTSSNKAIIGLYYYKKDVFKYINEINPSKRNELEITDLNNLLLDKDQLKVTNLPRSYYWNDAGSCEGFIESSNFIDTLSKRSKFKFAYIEEIALRKKFITDNEFNNLINKMPDSTYKQNLIKSVRS